MQGFSTYNMMNYDVVPLGLDKNGNSVGLRIPMTTGDRVLSNLLWSAMTNKDHPLNAISGSAGNNLFNFLGGDLPSLNPLLTTAGKASTLFQGKDPQDDFRGRPIVSAKAMKAGLIPQWEEFLKWAWNENGGSALHRFSTGGVYNQDPSDIQKFLAMPVVSPLVGRLILVDSYGLKERADAEKLNQ
jgi:hypothetical protein